MKVALCSTLVPFATADGRLDGLRQALVASGHQVEQVSLPWSNDPAVAFQQLAACRWIDLQSNADRIICLGPPAHAIPHTCKVIWLAGEFACQPLPQSDSSTVPEGGLRAAILAAHAAALREGRHVFVTSDPAARCLPALTGAEFEVLEEPAANWHSVLDRLLG